MPCSPADHQHTAQLLDVCELELENTQPKPLICGQVKGSRTAGDEFSAGYQSATGVVKFLSTSASRDTFQHLARGAFAGRTSCWTRRTKLDSSAPPGPKRFTIVFTARRTPVLRSTAMCTAPKLPACPVRLLLLFQVTFVCNA